MICHRQVTSETKLAPVPAATSQVGWSAHIRASQGAYLGTENGKDPGTLQEGAQ